MHGQIRRLLTILAFLILVLICAYILQSVDRLFPTQDSFCSPEDVVYQTVAQQAVNWMAKFPANYSPDGPHSFPFTINGDARTYDAAGFWERDLHGKPILIYVITGSDVDNQFGSEGYIYAPAGVLTSNFWLDNYWTKRSDAGIYCYKLL